MVAIFPYRSAWTSPDSRACFDIRTTRILAQKVRHFRSGRTIAIANGGVARRLAIQMTKVAFLLQSANRPKFVMGPRNVRSMASVPNPALPAAALSANLLPPKF